MKGKFEYFIDTIHINSKSNALYNITNLIDKTLSHTSPISISVNRSTIEILHNLSNPQTSPRIQPALNPSAKRRKLPPSRKIFRLSYIATHTHTHTSQTIPCGRNENENRTEEPKRCTFVHRWPKLIPMNGKAQHWRNNYNSRKRRIRKTTFRCIVCVCVYKSRENPRDFPARGKRSAFTCLVITRNVNPVEIRNYYFLNPKPEWTRNDSVWPYRLALSSVAFRSFVGWCLNCGWWWI